MGMYDAMYRMFFEKDGEEYKRIVCSTTLAFTVLMSLAVFFTVIILRKVIANYFFGNEKYVYIVYLSSITILVSATNSIISAPTRMQNKRRIFLIANAISPLIGYAISIPLLLMGYYTVALPIAAIVSGIIIETTFLFLNHQWFSLKLFDRRLLKTLLKLAIPIFPAFLMYWIFNSCDKVMITNMIGIGAVGIYSVGSKLGHASQLIYTAFAGGWQYFAFSTMRDKNQVETNSRIYEYLGVISFIFTALICVISYPLFNVLFKKEYLEGFVIAPYLFLAPLLLMLHQISGNQLLVVKKPWTGFFILPTGAIMNVVLNYLLIPKLGIEGAAIATLSGYVVVCLLDIVILTKLNLMKLKLRFLWCSILVALFIVLWRLLFLKSILIGFLFWGIFTAVCQFLYNTDILILMRK